MGLRIKKGKQLPQTVYLFWLSDDQSEPFLMAYTDLNRAVAPGEKRLVGVYELKNTGMVESVVSLKSDL